MKTYTIAWPHGSFSSGLDKIEILNKLHTLPSGATITVDPEPVYDFDVFYASRYPEQGWSQHCTIKAASWRDAAMQRAKRNKRHSPGTRYLVVGSEPTGGKRGREYAIVPGTAEHHDYVSIWNEGRYYYNVTEVGPR